MPLSIFEQSENRFPHPAPRAARSGLLWPAFSQKQNIRVESGRQENGSAGSQSTRKNRDMNTYKHECAGRVETTGVSKTHVQTKLAATSHGVSVVVSVLFSFFSRPFPGLSPRRAAPRRDDFANLRMSEGFLDLFISMRIYYILKNTKIKD